jgi:hypothetical protein
MHAMNQQVRCMGALLAALVVTAASASAAPSARGTKRATAPLHASTSATKAGADTSRGMTLKGGDEGTVFRSLTVEGEDRIHIEVERPVLKLDMDPAKAPGLERGDVKDVLERTTPDLETPLRAISAHEPSPWIAHPWLAHFSEGAVARMRPDVRGVERWRLVIVNARAESVAVFQGKGDPPREIAWDGRATDGSPVRPGATYSYVFEARDRAGNKRNFVGEGFRVNAFRYGTPESPTLVFSGNELARSSTTRGLDDVPPIVTEVATILNQAPVSRAVQIEITARGREEANALALRLGHWLAPLVLGDPARFQNTAVVQSDAPVGGAVKITVPGPEVAGQD